MMVSVNVDEKKDSLTIARGGRSGREASIEALGAAERIFPLRPEPLKYLRTAHFTSRGCSAFVAPCTLPRPLFGTTHPSHFLDLSLA